MLALGNGGLTVKPCPWPSCRASDARPIPSYSAAASWCKVAARLCVAAACRCAALTLATVRTYTRQRGARSNSIPRGWRILDQHRLRDVRSAGRWLRHTNKRHVMVPSLLFVTSFSLIFVLLGVGATLFGSSFAAHRQLLDKVAAVLIIALGVLFVTSTSSCANRELAPRRALMNALDAVVRSSPAAAFVVAWTPRTGPTLGRSCPPRRCRAPRCTARSCSPCTRPVAIPFLATALAFEHMTSLFAVIKRHFRIVIGAGGVVLIAMGVLIWSGELYQLNIHAQNALNSLGINFFDSI